MGVKVQHNGQEIEVDLPAGFLAEDDVKQKYVAKDFMEQEIGRRLKGKADPDKLLDDETFMARAREKLGIKAEKPGKPSGEDVEKLHQTWSREHVEPLKLQLGKTTEEVESLRVRDLTGQIVQAAASLGLKKALLTSPVEGQDPPVVHLLRAYFGYDPERRAWFVKNGDGFAYGASPTAERPYKGVAEFLADWAKDKANAEWLEDQRQRGAGLGKPGQGQGPDLSKLSPTERLKQFRAAQS